MDIIGYDVVSDSVIDKHKSWYNKGTIYSRQLLGRYNYFLEAVIYNPKDKNYDKYFIFSEIHINNKCHNMNYDEYGRYRFKPTKFKTYFNDYFNNKSFDLILHEHTEEYDVYRIP